MLNKCVLMGRLTKDFDMKTTTGGTTIGRTTLAIDRRFQRQGEERQTDFINILCFNKTAEFANKYFSKGNMMCVVGSIQTRSWEGQDGKKNYATEVIADEVNFCGSKKEASDTSAKNNDEFMPIEDEEPLPF